MRTRVTKLQARQQELHGQATGTHMGAFLLVLAHEIGDDDIMGMAAEMAYRFLFALFPMLLFLTAGLGFVGKALGFDDLFSWLLGQIQPLLPGEIYALVEGYLRGLLGERSPAFLAIGIIGTVWGASGGVGTLIKGLNRAYDVEQSRPFWQRQLLAMLAIILLLPIGLAFFIVGALGRVIVDALIAVVGLEQGFALLFTVARWPVLMLLLFSGLSILYFVLPNVSHKYWWSLPGSAFATVGWAVLTIGFSVYLSSFTNYDATYGSFSTIIVFMLWLYLVSVVLLIGAEINVLLEPVQRDAKVQLRREESSASLAEGIPDSDPYP